ncbi:glycoside hydrolase family 18 [Brevibacillus sp. SYP-B805]|uniref:glycosyl hydrolase family 18 protein n=1 Tax=Brevibacillus sp. SYP-B805 TaxID=1578199 RepID=UPI0013EB85F8|nr:glycosyl hydrolase family 18 protein [Brevibacillus sp. SYP-B805]NGQ96648.1 glycoside hydrolase family 18 [Brevibacillus sp. SYP-B805]
MRKFRTFLFFLLILTVMVIIPILTVNSATFFQLHQVESPEQQVQDRLATESWLAVMKEGVPLPANKAPAAATKTVLGYYVEYGETDRASYQALASFGSMLTDVAMVIYNAAPDGSLQGKPSPPGLEAARAKRLHTYLVVTNHGEKLFDRNLAHTLLTDKTVSLRLRQNLLSKAKELSATGINLDIENVPAGDRDAYAAFVANLADDLHRAGKKLIVSVPAKTADNPADSWSYGCDYAKIGAKSDYVQIMTYDEHGPWSEVGPVASYPWVESVVRYATKVIPPEKVLLGVGFYGYEWSSAGNRALPSKAIPELIAQYHATVKWDDKAKSPTLTYVKDGVTRTVWYEDERSLRAKRELAEAYHLGGYGVWRLGFEDQSFWNALVR